MDTRSIQTDIARIRIDDRLAEAARARRARAVHSPRRPRPEQPVSST